MVLAVPEAMGPYIRYHNAKKQPEQIGTIMDAHRLIICYIARNWLKSDL